MYDQVTSPEHKTKSWNKNCYYVRTCRSSSSLRGYDSIAEMAVRASRDCWCSKYIAECLDLKMTKLSEKWRQLHSKQLQNLYSECDKYEHQTRGTKKNAYTTTHAENVLGKAYKQINARIRTDFGYRVVKMWTALVQCLMTAVCQHVSGNFWFPKRRQISSASIPTNCSGKPQPQSAPRTQFYLTLCMKSRNERLTAPC
jgi:hypothetical protein